MNTLVLKDFAGVPEIAPEAFELKRKALDAAFTVKKVETEQELTVAVAALRELKSISKGIEMARKAVKSPVIDLGKKIDTIAHDFLREIDKSENVIQGMVNHYQRKQLEGKRAEEEKLVREQAEAVRLREQAEKESDASKRAELERKATDAEMSAEVSQPLAIAQPRGLVTRERVDFHIVDPILFVQGYPDFWKRASNGAHENEVLKLDRLKVLEELNREDGKGLFHRTSFPEELSKDIAKPQLVQPPGMNVFLDTKTHVR